MEEKVREVINEIKPALQADGGDIELVEIKDKVVWVRLLGACGGCPMAQLTLQFMVERQIKEKVPEVERVEAV
ncbi:MAG: NifU family protein [Acidobacteria bacterium]|nr:NifU family protein [Acidobacteriota bacterium]